ncbi:hypothetical protein JOM56_014554 [Amanita muscaria]
MTTTISGQSNLIQWLSLRDSILDELLRHDGLGSFIGQQNCNVCSKREAGPFRCRDCGHGSQLLCRECLILKHHGLELHRIEKWNGKFFEKETFSGVGLGVQLGHDGGPCPCPLQGPKHFMVFDTSGVHTINVDYCNCHPTGLLDRRVQLLRRKWFPATFVRPQTAFTFDCLDMFHELTLQGKVNLYDFYHSILRRTDNANIRTFINRYPEMHRVFRLWRNMMALKRAGRGHDPTGVDGTLPGGLVVECPACPHPGRNLPNGWDKAGPLLYLYILYLAIDANFKLKGKDRKIEDVELMPGTGVFVHESKYQEHIRNYVDQPEINTCQSEHEAIVRASTRNMPGYAVSGAGLVLCSRHSLVRKNGVGDLQKGERYSNMDYIILSALLGVTLPRVILTYDIACQWSKKFEKRMVEGFPPHMRISNQTRIDTAIPSWHINGHGQSCRQNFCLGYMKGAGRTCGEEVEVSWSHTNPLAPSVREMGPEARHETLNDHWNSWNFHKIVGFRKALLKKFKEAARMKIKHADIHQQFSGTFAPSTIKKWLAMVSDWEADPAAPNPYEEPVSDSISERTLQDARLELSREEAAERVGSDAPPPHKISLTGFLTTGFDLEDRHRRKAGNTSKQLADLQDKRSALLNQIQNWRQAQLVYTPHVAPMVAANPTSDENGNTRIEVAEKISLFLPSSLPAHVRALSEIDYICNMEKRLRVAQADDVLVEIRRQCRIVQGLWQFKKIHVSGTGNRPSTRMHTLYSRIIHKIERAANRYRMGRAALLVLDPDGELLNVDLRGPGKDPDDTKTSNGRFEPSWIWLVPWAGKSTQTEDEFNESMALRWEEEFEILQEEMRRVLAWFDWRASWWETQARLTKEGTPEVLHGISAYAFKQLDLVQCMAARCAASWIPELKKHGIKPVWEGKYEGKYDKANMTNSSPTEDNGTLGDDVERVDVEPESSSEHDDDDDDIDDIDDIDNFEFDDYID